MYDEELALKDIIDEFKNGLNAQIDCINTNKGAAPADSLYIPNIPDTKYIPVTLGVKQLLNYTGFFISYGIADTPIREASQVNYMEDFTVMVEVATFDSGNRNPEILYTQFLRYRKAMKNLIMKNPDILRGYGKLSVGSLKPAAFPYSNKKVILSIGLNIKASFTAI